MKVISKGPDRNWRRRVTCNGCSAVLEIERDDCRYVSDQRDGDYYDVACPECKYHITIAVRSVEGRWAR